MNEGGNNMHETIWNWVKKNKTNLILGLAIAASIISLWFFQEKDVHEFWRQLVSAILIACSSSLLVRLINHNVESDLEKRRKDTKEIHGKLQSTLDIVEGKKCTFCANSIVNVKRNRRECDLEKFFSEAKTEICILATHLESFVDYTHKLCDLSMNGIKVRIATMDPENASSFNDDREVDIGVNNDDKKRKMEIAINIFKDYMEMHRAANIELKKYSSITTTLVLIFRDNEYCYVANLIHGKRTRDTMHLLVRNDITKDSPYAMFHSHFESIYNSSKCTMIFPVQPKDAFSQTL